ncbi:cell polarity protein [Mucor ambiguus]|uniref:Cell polarity protein n=1 Tax=Mucor ambiguus TaxID=91626 RepID=A0A0C9MDH2_9FUNG|nr:cell polarity protein [Mucor ambiguus]
MSYSRSPPRSPSSSQEDWLLRGPQSAKTYSTSSSRSYSHASRSQSLASASSRAFSTTNYEGTAKTYYVELKSYLKELLAQEAIDGPHPHRVAARQKLTRLSNLQFHELAMDVYDEVVRRNKNDKFLPFLAVKEEFHPKRNQARQKLATLPVARFQDLASDVYSELTRRYPNLIENDQDTYSHLPPIPKIPASPTYNNTPQPSKSTNIVPVKGMINVENVVDNDMEEDENRYNRSPTSTVVAGTKEPKDYFSRSTAPLKNEGYNQSSDIEKIRSDYEYQINMMTSRIKQLQDQVEDKSSSKADKDLVEKLRMREQDDQKMIRQMEEQYKKLNDKYEALNREYSQQQEAVQNVKKETKQMLDELKRLAKVNEELYTEKEKAENTISQLKEEAKEWQIKYEKARIELRSVKASSMIELDHNQNIIKDNFLQPTRDGVIPQDHILTYQAYVNDLLTAARSNDPAQVIQVMKNIVTVCRSITEEIENQEDVLSTDTKKSLYELKTIFSSSLSDLLVAAKYHASGMGLSPVSLLDRSVGHLTSVIVELVKLLGMNSASPIVKSNASSPTDNKITTSTILSSLNDDTYGSKRLDNNSYYGSSISNGRSNGSISNHKSNGASSNGDDIARPSVRSGLDSFTGYKSSNSNSMYSSRKYREQDDLSPNELVKYLKTETDHIVQTIQNLLAALRLPQQNGEAHSIITALLKIVATISELSKATCQTTQGYRYRNECDPVLNQLGQCSQRISMIQTKYFARGAMATANAKRDLAKEAYEVAKFTKELITLFES